MFQGQFSFHDEHAAAISQPFVTSKGHLGLVEGLVIAEDHNFVITGAGTRFIFRKLEDRTLEVIGNAYVHGTMHGETVNENPKYT